MKNVLPVEDGTEPKRASCFHFQNQKGVKEIKGISVWFLIVLAQHTVHDPLSMMDTELSWCINHLARPVNHLWAGAYILIDYITQNEFYCSTAGTDNMVGCDRISQEYKYIRCKICVDTCLQDFLEILKRTLLNILKILRKCVFVTGNMNK